MDGPQAANILLMGPRASGKTTVAVRLAADLERQALDLDHLTLGRLGARSVAHAWRDQGEAAWRQAELAALGDCLALTAVVLALGGGTPEQEAARRAIETRRAERRAWVVYLACPLPVLEQRLRQGPGDRPPLLGTDTVAEVADIVARRDPIYRSVADLVVEGDRPVATVARQIAAAWRTWVAQISPAGTSGDQGGACG